MNSKHENTNLKGGFALKTVFKRSFLVYKNRSDSDLVTNSTKHLGLKNPATQTRILT